MAYQPPRFLPIRLRPGAIYEYGSVTRNVIDPIYYQQAAYHDYVGMQGMANSLTGLGNLLGGMGAGLNQAFYPPQQYQQLPEKHPLPVKSEPQKKPNRYNYELIQEIKAGAPFVVPKLFSADEVPKPTQKSSTEETVLAAVDLGQL